MDWILLIVDVTKNRDLLIVLKPRVQSYKNNNSYSSSKSDDALQGKHIMLGSMLLYDVHSN
jgi:hypothetical protein